MDLLPTDEQDEIIATVRSQLDREFDLHALAASARDEVTARERIDRTRAVYQSSMKRLVVIGAMLVAYLRVAGGELLTPYDSAVGQVVLVLPLGMWLGCVLWLRALCRYEPTPRYRIKGSSSVPGTAEQAGAHR